MVKVREIGFKNLGEHTKLGFCCIGLILLCGTILILGRMLHPSSFDLDPTWRKYSTQLYETSVVLNAMAFTLTLTLIAYVIAWKTRPLADELSKSSVRRFQMLFLFAVLWCLSVVMIYFPRSSTYHDLNHTRPATLMEALNDGTVISLRALTPPIPVLKTPVKEAYKIAGSDQRGMPMLTRWIFEFTMFSLVLMIGFYILAVMEIWYILRSILGGRRVSGGGREGPAPSTS